MARLSEIRKAVLSALLPWFEEQATTGEKWVAHDANRAADDVINSLLAAGLNLEAE